MKRFGHFEYLILMKRKLELFFAKFCKTGNFAHFGPKMSKIANFAKNSSNFLFVKMRYSKCPNLFIDSLYICIGKSKCFEVGQLPILTKFCFFWYHKFGFFLFFQLK